MRACWLPRLPAPMTAVRNIFVGAALGGRPFCEGCLLRTAGCHGGPPLQSQRLRPNYASCKTTTNRSRIYLHPSALAKRVSILIAAITIAFYLYGLGKLPLLGPDEPRYVEVARGMFLSGDLITPRLGGHTWFEKPALLYWMIVAAFKIFGVSEWSARVGPALCGLLTIAAVWRVGREIRAGESSALVMATCLSLIAFSRVATFDVVVTMT